jgi:hypothetical protein
MKSPSLVKWPSSAKIAFFFSNKAILGKVPYLVKSPSLAMLPTSGKAAFHGEVALLSKAAQNCPLWQSRHPQQNRLPWQSCRWRHCQHPADVVTGVVLTLLPLLPLHCHQHRAGVFNLVMMGPLPLLRWHHPPCWHLLDHDAACNMP